MQRTIFSTPLVNSLVRAVSVLVLRLTGWTVLGALPPEARKSVFIAAPHTSNWDLPNTLMVAFALRETRACRVSPPQRPLHRALRRP